MYGIAGLHPTLEQRVTVLEAKVSHLESVNKTQPMFKEKNTNYYMYGVYEKETN